MTATLGYYNPAFYANEALIWLRKSLGMANRVHMGFDEERRTFNKGDVINIRRPGSFVAAAAPSTAVDLSTESVQIALDQHYEVKFKLTDKNLAYTGERIIEEHIAPAAYALADKIDSDGCALYKAIPNFRDVAGGASTTMDVADVIGARKVLFDAKVPITDVSRMHFMLDSGGEASLLGKEAFSQFQGSGQVGVATQQTGVLQPRYGFNFFANQNVPSHTKGTSSDTALQIDNGAGYAAGVSTINLDAVDAGVTGTLVPGDVLTITHTTAGVRNYVVTNTVTAAANDLVGVQISPPLAEAVVDDQAVTARLDNHVAMLAFHRDAFALAFAKLPDFSNQSLFGAGQLGAAVASVQDPVTGLAVRSRIYYVGNSSEIHVALDVLYGWKCLDPYLAVRVCG
jgi:hypothetical protein